MEAKVYEYWVMLAAKSALFILFLRMICNGIAFYYTGASTLFSTWIDSIQDFMISCVNGFVLRRALQPPTAQHPFGCGKIEHLWALLQGVLISASALFLLKNAWALFFHPETLVNLEAGAAITLVSTVLMSLLCILQWKVSVWTGSPAIRANFLNNFGDILTSFAILAVLGLANLGLLWADPIIAMLMAGYLFYSALCMVYEAVEHLCDRQLSAEERKSVLAVLELHQGLSTVQGLRTRRAGPVRFIEFSIAVSDPALEVGSVDARIRAIKQSLELLFPAVDVVGQIVCSAENSRVSAEVVHHR